MARERRPVPNPVALAEAFEALETKGLECEITKALEHLRAAKRAFLEAGNENMRRK